MRTRNVRIGPSNVREWSRRLHRDAAVLELACGHGVVSQVLIEEGFAFYGIDASPTLLNALRGRFPGANLECALVEESDFFGRSFDAVVAWGLLFLLPAETQIAIIRKAAGALDAGGRLMFTAPAIEHSGSDATTGQDSVSLGRTAYLRAIEDAGLALEGEDSDIGDNHYYFARKI